MTYIVERLRQWQERDCPRAMRIEAAAEIERLKAEAAEWKERWAAERHDHEATMKAWDEERSGL